MKNMLMILSRFLTYNLSSIRRALSRGEWTVRLLSLSRSPECQAEPGLILIQIDGLARSQMEQAIRAGRLPFLKRLLQRKGYRVYSFYSGLPASTPAVQGELFYGVRCAVPSFGFRDHTTGKTVSMLNPNDVLRVQERLEASNPGLFTDGAVYSDVFTGGAKMANFCTTSLGLGNNFRESNPFAQFLALILHGFIFMRAAALMLIELGLAMIDFFRGLIEGKDIVKELFFVPSRVGISLLLREFVTAGVIIDATRGLPIIHCNFLGYDEQSHRRGPSSAFAHWTLKGIDGCIKRIWRAAKRSGCRKYEIWIYSDHGQETSTPYQVAYDQIPEISIGEILQQMGVQVTADAPQSDIIRLLWAKLLGSQTWQNSLPQPDQLPAQMSVDFIAKGPVGHVYLPEDFSLATRRQLGRTFIEKASVPIVMATDIGKQVIAWTSDGVYSLPEETAAVIGDDHPFLEELKEDIVTLIHHPDAGDFVLFGWSPKGTHITFPIENGAHAAFGTEETHSFALLTDTALTPEFPRNYLRPSDLREAVLRFLSRSAVQEKEVKQSA